VPFFSFGQLSKQSVLCSFDLASDQVREVSNITVCQAQPRAVG
jgi:hypothetical protein